LFIQSKAKLDAVKTYMRMRRVPRHLQVKVIKWFDYLWFTQKSSDEEKSVGGLPGTFDIIFCLTSLLVQKSSKTSKLSRKHVFIDLDIEILLCLITYSCMWELK
jgi:hypothetical protein